MFVYLITSERRRRKAVAADSGTSDDGSDSSGSGSGSDDPDSEYETHTKRRKKRKRKRKTKKEPSVLTYIGTASDPWQRLEEHNRRKSGGARETKAGAPAWELQLILGPFTHGASVVEKCWSLGCRGFKSKYTRGTRIGLGLESLVGYPCVWSAAVIDVQRS